jgi:YD repeat-containing protein
MKNTRSAGFLSFVILILSIVPAQAQNTQASGLDAQVGIMPFHSYHGGDIDSVNLTNGKLQVTIPLISYEQRGGKLKLDYALIYQNTGMYIPGCLPTAFSSGACAVVFPFQNGFFPAEMNKPGGSVGCSEKVVQDVFGNQYFNFPCSASVTSPDGVGHLMVPTSPTTFVAADGSGYRADLLPGSDVTNPNHQAGVIISPDGIRVPGNFLDTPVAHPVYSEDTNGNQMVGGSGGVVDTLGRTIPAMGSFPVSLPGGFPAGIGITDFSGCSGPLPITGATAWNPPGVDGGTYPLKFCYVNVAEINPGGFVNFESCGPPPAGCEQFDVTVPPLPTISTQLQSVVLPNGTSWTFEYTTDGFGNLSRITFPTGGTISYTWTPMDQNGAIIDSLPPMTRISPQGIATRTVDPNDGSSPAGQWSYNYVRGTIGTGGIVNGTFVTTVTDPAQNDTVHTFQAFDNSGNIFETLTQTYSGPAGGQLLRTVQTDYKTFTMQSPGIPTLVGFLTTLLPIRHTTTLDNGLQTKTEQDWDSGFLASLSDYQWDLNNQNLHALSCGSGCSGGMPYGVIMATREYDYAPGAPGPLLRTTSVSRPAFSDSRYFSNNLLNLVSTKTVTDGAGHFASSTTEAYDETPLIPSGISTNLDPNPPAGIARGNLTSETEIINAPPNSCNANVAGSDAAITKVAYFDTGTVAQHFDPLGNRSTFNYSPVFEGAYPTQVCNALNQCVNTNYDFITGLKTSISDVNGQTMSMQYDIMGRLSSFTLPAQDLNGTAVEGGTTFTYNDTPGEISVTQLEKQDGVTLLRQITRMDGLGRKIQGQMTDPEGDVFTKTTFDEFGRVVSVTNPYRSISDATYGVTTNKYDELGRLVQVTHPDSSTTLTTYSGRSVQTQDEGNGSTRATRISQSDGLGRMTSLCEVTNATQINHDAPQACGQDIRGTGFLTTYQYNAADELTHAQQGGISRSLLYDTAGRLLSATNPESGTTCYQYDANGNLSSRTRPAPNQSDPLATVTTSFQYDPLNRQISVVYSDSITPSVSKHYDTAQELGIDLSNTIGRLSAVYVTSPAGQLLSGEVYGYDPMGRIIENSQCTPQKCCQGTVFPMNYTYDLLGNDLSSSNGMGVTFSYVYSGNRLVNMTSGLADSNHPASLFHDALYSPSGDLSAVTLGNAIRETLTYNNMGRITGYATSSPPTTSAGDFRSMLLLSAIRQASSRLPMPASAPPIFRPHTQTILIATAANRRKSDRATMTFRFRSVDLLYPPASMQVAYRGQKALTVARILARQINKDPTLFLRARTRHRGPFTYVDLSSRAPGKPSDYMVSASVRASSGIPSIQVRTMDLQVAQFLVGENSAGSTAGRIPIPALDTSKTYISTEVNR